MNRIWQILFSASFCAMTQHIAIAQPVFSLGAGSSVLTIDRVATFDSITASDINLVNYSEGALSITVPDNSHVGSDVFGGGPLTGYFYGTNGNQDWVTIRGVDNALFRAAEFRFGTGYEADNVARLRWATFRNGTETGTGQVLSVEGTVAGLRDPQGFDELRLIADDNAAFTPTNGTELEFYEPQAIGIDDLKMELVPEPASCVLILGMLLFSVRQRRVA
jgi:hypothetical protein